MSDQIQHFEVNAFTIPTETPESDGTAEWASTTLVLVRLRAQGSSGLGYSYAHECCAPFIRKTLFPILRGKGIFDVALLWREMNIAARNFGRNGIPSSAIAAVDAALWDLKARVVGISAVKLMGAVRENIPVYGSGGFTSYSEDQLCRQLEGWAAEDISMVKMKIGREPPKDASRVAAARHAIGGETGLFVDANGAYTVKESLEKSGFFEEQNVTWFEEPVSAENLPGLQFIREHTQLEIAAGEYNYDLRQARAMCEAASVDVLQADATRCGVTGFLQMAALCEAFEMPLSAHAAPAIHAHLCCAVNRARHVEYFFDHVRIEQMLFEGATIRHEHGRLRPDPASPGWGLEFKTKEAAKFLVNI